MTGHNSNIKFGHIGPGLRHLAPRLPAVSLSWAVMSASINANDSGVVCPRAADTRQVSWEVVSRSSSGRAVTSSRPRA
jgi:hypothetical protein